MICFPFVSGAFYNCVNKETKAAIVQMLLCFESDPHVLKNLLL